MPKRTFQELLRARTVEFLESPYVKINTIAGKVRPLKIINIDCTIGNISRNAIFYVVDSPLNYCILSNESIGLFKLNLNFENFCVYQNGRNISTELTVENNQSNYIFLTYDNDESNHAERHYSENIDNCCDNFHSSINNNCDSGINDSVKLNKLLNTYDHVFAKSKYDVGCIRLEPQRVVLESELPISMRPYRASVKDNEEIKKQIDELLAADIIKPSHSPYSAPITLAYKKDENSKSRMCIDYRKLNSITRTDSEPIPLLNAILDQLTNAKIFSTLDLASGYWHIQIDEKDTEKLAFTSNFGLYEWKRLPFGWKNAPAIFQRTLRQILNKYEIKFALNYFDDIIIFSNSFEEHITHLKTLFSICEKENIKLKFSKCQFAQRKIKFLGYEVEEGKYQPNNANIEIIKKLQPPKNVKDLQRFLGSVNVYNKFIKDYAKLRVPLNKLLKKDVKFEWTDECQQAFKSLKDALISKPVLTIHNPNYPCHIFVDASGKAIGAVLKQQHPDGSLHPIAYHSRKLKSYEQNYAITELECLAIIDAVDKFYCYLHGTHFTIHTDHASLVWLKNIKNPTGRLFRWSLKLSMYNFDIKYKKGSTNHEADMLSRNPISHHITVNAPLLTIQEIELHQNLDNVGGGKYKKINNVWTIRKQGLIKIVVPFSLRLKLLEKAHLDYGHLGISAMLNLISPQYYWFGITKDVYNSVKHCEVCQINKKSRQKRFGLLQMLPPTNEPFDILAIDTVGGLNYYNSTKKYLHIVIDHATRYIWTFASKNVNTDTYINCLMQSFKNQMPRKILSDRNGAFTSSKFKHFLKRNNITQLLTTAHRPQTNGKNERVNQTLITRLKCKLNSHPGNVSWTKLLREVTEEYNNTPHNVTKFSPAYLMLGKFPHKNLIDNQEIYPPIEEARKIARERTIKHHAINKERYDTHFKESKFNVGDIVMYEEFHYPNTPKLTPPYSGPYKILKQISNVNFEIDKPNALTKKDSEIVHCTRLRHFNPAENFKLEPRKSKIPISVPKAPKATKTKVKN